ncbi:hypothetical protein SRHO_G00088000 [Serrasalmus rhombeus]
MVDFRRARDPTSEIFLSAGRSFPATPSVCHGILNKTDRRAPPEETLVFWCCFETFSVEHGPGGFCLCF